MAARTRKGLDQIVKILQEASNKLTRDGNLKDMNIALIAYLEWAHGS